MKKLFTIIMKKLFAAIILLMISMGFTTALFLIDAKCDPGGTHPESLEVTIVAFSIYSVIIFLPLFVTYLFVGKEILALFTKPQF